jgi:hypothetical protein
MLNLTDRDRQILDLDFEGYTHNEIANKLGITKQSVDNQIQRAITRNKNLTLTHNGMTRPVDSKESLLVLYLQEDKEDAPPQPTMTAQELEKLNMHEVPYKGGRVKGKIKPNGRVYLCCICKRQPTIRKNYYCIWCYKKHKADILAKEEWILWCFNEEKRQRRSPDPVVDYDIKPKIELDAEELEELHQDFIDDRFTLFQNNQRRKAAGREELHKDFLDDDITLWWQNKKKV